MTTDLRSPHLDTLAAIVSGRPICVSWEHAFRLLEAGAVEAFEASGDLVRDLTLTDAGRALGEERKTVLDARSKAAAKGRRSRADACRSLGLRRTKAGGWE